MPFSENVSTWSSDETAEHLLELQDQTVDLYKVLRLGARALHTHFFGWIDPEAEEVKLFESEFEKMKTMPSAIQNIQDSRNLYTGVSNFYKGQFSSADIQGDVIVSYPSGMPFLPRGIVVPGNVSWPVDRTINLFPMIDFQFELVLTRSKLLERMDILGETFPIRVKSPQVNTTRVGKGSDFYQVDLALGLDQPRDLQRIKAHFQSGIRYNSVDISSYSISPEGQALVTDLLAARA